MSNNGLPLSAGILLAGVSGSFFGPYIIGPVRLEHIVIYSLFFFLTCAAIFWPTVSGALRKTLVGPPFPLFVIAWSLLLPLSIFSHIGRFGLEGGWALADFLSGLDGIALPIATFVSASVLIELVGRDRAFRIGSSTIVWLMCANAVVSAVFFLGGDSSALEPFHQSLTSEIDSVYEVSGRTTGIFNQPIEASVAYSLAGILAVTKLRSRPVWGFLALALITFGGTIAVSKVFSFGGLFLIVASIALTNGARKAAVYTFLVVPAASIAAFRFPIVFNHYQRLFDSFSGASDESPLYILTSGRNESPLVGSADTATRDVFFGYGPSGVGGYGVTLDTALLQIVSIAGVVGFLAWLLTLAFIIHLTVKQADRDFLVLGIGVCIIIIGASFGFEPLSANRSGTVIWTILALLNSQLVGGLRNNRGT